MANAGLGQSLGIKVNPSDVRLKPSEDGYAWKLEDSSLASLFQTNLSKHSIGAYLRLLNGVGTSFYAVRVSTSTQLLEKSHEGFKQVSDLASELQAAKKKAAVLESLLAMVNSSTKLQEQAVREIQEMVNIHEQSTHNWISLVQFYQAKHQQATCKLGQIANLLQGMDIPSLLLSNNAT